jgi:hypothetical protein
LIGLPDHGCLLFADDSILMRYCSPKTTRQRFTSLPLKKGLKIVEQEGSSLISLSLVYYQGSESAPFSGVRKYPGVRDNKWATYRYFLTFLGSKDRFYLLLVLFLVLI